MLEDDGRSGSSMYRWVLRRGKREVVVEELVNAGGRR